VTGPAKPKRPIRKKEPEVKKKSRVETKPRRSVRKKEPVVKKKSRVETKPRRSIRLQENQCYVYSCSVCLLPILQDISKDRNALRAENELLARENALLREKVRVLKLKLRSKK
jgi:hypothetical protein